MYDYVIVGAGSAGCVVAHRLGEDADVRVAVLEAGPPDDAPEIHMPARVRAEPHQRLGLGAVQRARAGSGRPPQLPASRPRARRLELAQRDDLHPRPPRRLRRVGGHGPRGLGLRGRPAVLQARRGQRARAEPLPRRRRPAERQRQPLDASRRRDVDRGRRQAGIPHNDDLNGATQEGAGRYQLTQRDGRRCSTAVAYLHPAVARGNVDVLTDARVYRILFEGERAVGVRVHAPRPARAGPRRARGHPRPPAAYHSPQLLMLSGVGPPTSSTPLGIEARHELPVGQNLQDHVMLELRLPDRQGEPDLAAHPRGLRALRDRGARAGQLQRRRGRRVRPHPRRARRARRPVPHRLPAPARGVPRRARSTTPTPSAPRW